MWRMTEQDFFVPNDNVTTNRNQLKERFLGKPIPRLWCPALTHFNAHGELDRTRIAAHWRQMSPHVGGFLIPGSTGEGWELALEQVEELLAFCIEQASALNVRVIVGVLRQSLNEMLEMMDRMVALFNKLSGRTDPLSALEACHVCGFTVCAPTGAELSQEEIRRSLAAILQKGLPTALYQLPQVTRNEFSPDTFEQLAGRYPNLVLFKDTSGEDRVAESLSGDHDVFLVRGAEGGYARWLRESDGPYDGLLLSTANCFSPQYAQMIDLLSSGRTEAASELSEKLTAVVEQAFELASGHEVGNAFTNANKSIDHFLAYGKQAMEQPMPMLASGNRLPSDLVAAIGEPLRAAGWLPANGYLESTET